MDNRVILAVAGSGKTSRIINELKSSGRSLVVTYTENNERNLRNRIANECEDSSDRIRLYRYFPFLYSFCVRPFLGDELSIHGINWDQKPQKYTTKTSEQFYLDRNRRLYHNRMAKLLSEHDLVKGVKQRLSKYFDSFFVDEFQDFAGHDFNFLGELASASVQVLLVGDFYQHTYDTSRDGSTNKNLHKNLTNYKDKLKKCKFVIDDASLDKSYRCSPTVCEFVSEKMGINIKSHRNDKTRVEYVDSQEQADKLFDDNNIVKLFYQSHHKYPCFSENWGASKGIDNYNSICVVLNKTTDDHFKKGTLENLASCTKNKLYVACTRSAKDLYFVPDCYYTKHKT